MDTFFYRPWTENPSSDVYKPNWLMGIETGHIKNLPDNQADFVMALAYGDMQAQASIPRHWGINSPQDLSVVLWNNEFAASAGTTGGFRAWDPDNLKAGIQSFKDAETLLRYTSGGKSLFSPRAYPLPTAL